MTNPSQRGRLRRLEELLDQRCPKCRLTPAERELASQATLQQVLEKLRRLKGASDEEADARELSHRLREARERAEKLQRLLDETEACG